MLLLPTGWGHATINEGFAIGIGNLYCDALYANYTGNDCRTFDRSGSGARNTRRAHFVAILKARLSSLHKACIRLGCMTSHQARIACTHPWLRPSCSCLYASHASQATLGKEYFPTDSTGRARYGSLTEMSGLRGRGHGRGRGRGSRGGVAAAGALSGGRGRRARQLGVQAGGRQAHHGEGGGRHEDQGNGRALRSVEGELVGEYGSRGSTRAATAATARDAPPSRAADGRRGQERGVLRRARRLEGAGGLAGRGAGLPLQRGRGVPGRSSMMRGPGPPGTGMLPAAVPPPPGCARGGVRYREVAFVHINKAGGTAMRMMLYKFARHQMLETSHPAAASELRALGSRFFHASVHYTTRTGCPVDAPCQYALGTPCLPTPCDEPRSSRSSADGSCRRVPGLAAASSAWPRGVGSGVYIRAGAKPICTAALDVHLLAARGFVQATAAASAL